jgi:hypothetical protein
MPTGAIRWIRDQEATMFTKLSVLLVPALFAAASLSAGAAAAADACIPPKVIAALSDCSAVASLYLDSLNVLGSEGALSCFDRFRGGKTEARGRDGDDR